MKFLLIPDSFKGTLYSEQICGLLRKSIARHFPEADTVSIPVADGGEGSVDAFLAALGGEKRYLTVKNPFFEDMEAYYGLIDNGETAVIEMAACALKRDRCQASGRSFDGYTGSYRWLSSLCRVLLVRECF